MGSKWVTGSIILRKNIILDALHQATIRSYGSYAQGEDSYEIFSGLSENIKAYSNNKVILLFLFFLILLGIYAIRKKHKIISKKKMSQQVHLLVIILLPIIWYLGMREHSFIHVRFAYRNMSIVILAASCYLINILTEKDDSLKKVRKLDRAKGGNP